MEDVGGNVVEGDLLSDPTLSSQRERFFEYLFLARLLAHSWFDRRQPVEVLRADVDGAGYDLVLECGGVLRHVQLKGSYGGAKTARQIVHRDLEKKPSACVVWMRVASPEVRTDREDDGEGMNLRITYRYFGQEPGQPLRDLSDYPVARHTRGDRTGAKKPRRHHRVIPKRDFIEIGSIRQLALLLFGPCTHEPRR